MIKPEFRPVRQRRTSGRGEVGHGPVCIPTVDRGNEKFQCYLDLEFLFHYVYTNTGKSETDAQSAGVI